MASESPYRTDPLEKYLQQLKDSGITDKELNLLKIKLELQGLDKRLKSVGLNPQSQEDLEMVIARIGGGEKNNEELSLVPLVAESLAPRVINPLTDINRDIKQKMGIFENEMKEIHVTYMNSKAPQLQDVIISNDGYLKIILDIINQNELRVCTKFEYETISFSSDLTECMHGLRFKLRLKEIKTGFLRRKVMGYKHEARLGFDCRHGYCAIDNLVYRIGNRYMATQMSTQCKDYLNFVNYLKMFLETPANLKKILRFS